LKVAQLSANNLRFYCNTQINKRENFQFTFGNFRFFIPDKSRLVPTNGNTQNIFSIFALQNNWQLSIINSKIMLSLLNQHRTIRKYTEQPIDNELLDKLLTTACRASNTGNMQAYSVVVTTDQDIKQQLSPAHFNQPMIKQAPVVLTFCADYNLFSKWCEQRQAEPGYDNFQSFMATAIDTLLAAQTFCIAAESVGLGICYLGTTTYNAQEIIDTLKLPKLVVPVTTITVGYPAEMPEQTDRLPREAVVHRETYNDFAPTDIDRIYAEKENSDFYKQFVAENNKETLAQVFTDIRYTKKNNEFFSDKFMAAMKMQGFLK
jgi:nitroreductase